MRVPDQTGLMCLVVCVCVRSLFQHSGDVGLPTFIILLMNLFIDHFRITCLVVIFIINYMELLHHDRHNHQTATVVMSLLRRLVVQMGVFSLYFWPAGREGLCCVHSWCTHTCEQKKISLRCSCKQAPFHCPAKKRVLIDLAAKIMLFHFV